MIPEKRSKPPLIDELSGEVIEDRLRKYDPIGVRIPERFLHLYLACPNEKVDAMVRTIREGLHIPEEAMVEATINPHTMSIRNELSELLGTIGSLTENRVLVLVRGYERYFAPGHTNVLREERGGHDFDQDLREHRKFKDAPELKGKSLFILTHIGTSSGQDAFDRGIRSACRSQFVNEIFLIS